jgi:hypothetical protein
MIEHMKASGNYDLILRLCYRNLFGFLEQTLAVVTLRPNSVSKDISERHQNRSEILENLLRIYPDMKAPARRAVRAKIGKYLLKAGMRTARSGRLAAARKLLRRSLAYRKSPLALWCYVRCAGRAAASPRDA